MSSLTNTIFNIINTFNQNKLQITNINNMINQIQQYYTI